MDNEKVKKLKSILEIVNQDMVSRADFLKVFEKVIEIIREIRTKNSSEWVMVQEVVKKNSEKIASDVRTSLSTAEKRMMKQCMDVCQKVCSDMEQEHQQQMKNLEQDVRIIKEDRQNIIQDTIRQVPKYPEPSPVFIRDRLETLQGNERIDKSAIKGLDEELKRIESIRTTVRGGGTSAIGVAQAFKYIAHTEQPIGAINGSNVTYTVKNNIFWIAGFTLNGEQIAQLPNFTYSGRTITFSTALPTAYSGKDFEIKYIGT